MSWSRSFDLNHRPALWPDPRRAADVRRLHPIQQYRLDGSGQADAVFGTNSPLQIRTEFPEPEYLVVNNDAHHFNGFHENASRD